MEVIINELLKEFSPIDIEQALVQLFIEENKISVRKNKLILPILNNASSEIKYIKNHIKMKFPLNDIKQLDRAFEILIPKEDRKINGAVFTPTNITEFIVSELVALDNQTVCDPSCGCGAFLVAAVEAFKNKFNKKIEAVLRENIYGVDFLEYSVRRCKIILTLLALLNNEDKTQFNLNIVCKDSLEVDWHKLFPEVMSSGGFDIVVGNPPYVKFQDLPEKLRKELYNNWKTLKQGTYNLYFAFFELGVQIMKKEGTLGYITPNNYFTSLAAIHLREYLQTNRLIDKIIDFNHLRIFDVQTYTCITFLSRKDKTYFFFEKIDNMKSTNTLSNTNLSRISYSDLNPKKWRLIRDKDQCNIKKIEKMPNRLGALVDIKVGIATCKDEVYFIDGNTLERNHYKKIYKDKEYLIEVEITKPIDKISDFETQEDLENNARRIIFPYFIEKDKAYLINKETLKKKYPKCYDYFIAVKKELETRDKDKGQYEEWYAYARTQGLTLTGEKLLTPTFSRRPRFLYEESSEALFCNGYAIFNKKYSEDLLTCKIPLLTLAKILNSPIMAYYIENTSVAIEGGFYCYQKNFIELFGLPNFTEKEISFITSESSEIKLNNFLMRKYEIEL